MHKNEKTEQLRQNIEYLIKSRGETRLSLCVSSGITRSTIYNILRGRVTNVQHATIRKISSFFGVDCHEIETIDLETQESVNNSIALLGNRNPAAVPIIRESMLLHTMDLRIGELSTTHALTYYFGVGSNLIGVLLENTIPSCHEPGDLLIVKKGAVTGIAEKLAYDKRANRLFLTHQHEFEPDTVCVIGEVVEDRINAN